MDDAQARRGATIIGGVTVGTVASVGNVVIRPRPSAEFTASSACLVGTHQRAPAICWDVSATRVGVVHHV